MKLSPNFTYDELTTTSKRILNIPGRQELINLVYLCDRVLEPIRALWGNKPVTVNSGFRSLAVNEAVGGEPQSQHRYGQAADLEPPINSEEAFEMLADAVAHYELIVDQAIIYSHGMIHISYRADGPNRGQLLRSAAASGSRGPYTPWVRGLR